VSQSIVRGSPDELLEEEVLCVNIDTHIRKIYQFYIIFTQADILWALTDAPSTDIIKVLFDV